MKTVSIEARDIYGEVLDACIVSVPDHVDKLIVSGHTLYIGAAKCEHEQPSAYEEGKRFFARIAKAVCGIW